MGRCVRVVMMILFGLLVVRVFLYYRAICLSFFFEPEAGWGIFHSMKNLGIFVISFVGCAVALAEKGDLEKAEAYYQQALRAEKAGEVDKALRSFQAAVHLNPEHANARYKMGEMKILAPELKAKSKERRVGAVRLAEFRVEDASVRECVDLISREIEKATEGELAPNFVIEDPNNRLEGVGINLNLKDVPVEGVLKYIRQQAGTKVRFDPHAIVIIAR